MTDTDRRRPRVLRGIRVSDADADADADDVADAGEQHVGPPATGFVGSKPVLGQRWHMHTACFDATLHSPL